MALKTMSALPNQMAANGLGKLDSISQTLPYDLSDPKTRIVPEFLHPDQVLDYMCVFCEKVAVNEPHQALLCACRMCHNCVKEYVADCASKRQEAYCKGKTDDCQSEQLSFDNKRLNRVVRDRAAINDLELLEVKCPNHKSGCPWTGIWKNSHDHVNKECEWVMSTCKDCNAEVQRKVMEKHLSEECPKRTLNCQYCGVEMTAEVLEDHLDKDCKMNNETCDFCKLSVRKHLIVEHKERLCSKRLVHCEFAPWGCEFHDSLDKLEAHNQTSANSHLKIMMESMKSGGGHTSVNSNELQELKLKVDELYTEVATIRTRLDNFQNLNPAAQSQGNPAQQFAELSELCERLNKEVQELRAKTAASASASQRTEAQNSEAQDSQAVAAVDSGDADSDPNELRSFGRLAQQIDMTSFSGILIWKLPGFRGMREEARRGSRKQYYDSPPFLTSKFGYKMMGRVYPNGDGSGRNTHLSLFFVLLRGEFDDMLAWPFRQKVTFVLLDQDTSNPKNVIDTFRPDPNSVCFRKPTSEANLASGCPSFVPQSMLDSKASYLSNDTLYLKIIVDTTDLFYP